VLGRQPVVDAEHAGLRGRRDERDHVPQRGRRADLVSPAVQVQQHAGAVHARGDHPLGRHSPGVDLLDGGAGRRGRGDRIEGRAALCDRQVTHINAAQQLVYRRQFLARHRGCLSLPASGDRHRASIIAGPSRGGQLNIGQRGARAAVGGGRDDEADGVLRDGASERFMQ